jgi:hypothetical protein
MMNTDTHTYARTYKQRVHRSVISRGSRFVQTKGSQVSDKQRFTFFASTDKVFLPTIFVPAGINSDPDPYLWAQIVTRILTLSGFCPRARG